MERTTGIDTSALDRQQVISVNTRNTSLVLMVDDDRYVFHSYFGERLTTPENLLETIPVDPTRLETFEALSVFGGRYTGEPALKATHADGNVTTDLRYQSHEQVQVDRNITETRIKLKDVHYPLHVTLIYTAYDDEDIISSRVLIKNAEDGTVLLENFASGDLTAKSSEFWLSRFYGDWSVEMQMEEGKLGKGIRIIESKKGVRTTLCDNSAFVLSLGHPAEEEEGVVIGGALAWSGNYRLCFELDVRNQLHLTAGINPFGSAYRIDSGKTFETPPFIFTYSSAGKGSVSRRFHRWARRYSLRDGNMLRPVVLNSWEGAYFSFNENTLIQMMTHAASLGAEVFVLDDGWFGNKYPRNNESTSLGDWQVNKTKLPHGLDYLIDHAEREQLKFGIWIEPEMVSPKSELAENHPDWIMQRPNREPLLMRNQSLLDLSNPAVQEFVFSAVDNLLTAHPRIAYIKWDSNRHVENFGSPYLSADCQSHLWIDYVSGLYSVYDRLVQKHPGVLFQACASGGGRVDFGALSRHHEFWTSDNTDPFSRIFAQWGTSHFYPAMAMAAHVSASPNHQTGNLSPIKLRFDVAMAGRLGVELQPSDMTDHELVFSKKCIVEYKRIRDVIQLGDLYRLISPYKENRAALMYVTSEKDRAVLFAYVTRYHAQQDFPIVKLRGLDPAKTYRVMELNRDSEQNIFAGSGKAFSGNFLMNRGVQLKIHKANESAVLELAEEGAPV
jgi:alpha-galactosidase